MKSNIIAIDPGNEYSAYCVMDKETYKPIEFGKIINAELRDKLKSKEFKENISEMAIEMVACYGMAVGKTIFETCVWIGIFTESFGKYYEYIYRKEEKMNLCGTMKAKDSNIRQALIDRFGVVGVKKSPGYFYGFKSDIWSSCAVGCTYLDKINKN